MHFLRLSSLHLLSLALLLQGVLGADPLFNFCSTTAEKYTSNGAYEANLKKLTASLFYQVPPTGFGHNSVGHDPADRVYGLGQCRGDVSRSDCKTCIVNASSAILKLCPNDKEAIIWYDYCELKYSNVDFFSKIDTTYKFYMWNTQSVSNLISFNKKAKELLNKVATKAYHSSKMYASGEKVYDDSEKLYGLTQCTRDLSSKLCKECLIDAISDLPSCCDGKQGGRVVGGSCNIRYEIYPFVNS